MTAIALMIVFLLLLKQTHWFWLDSLERSRSTPQGAKGSHYVMVFLSLLILGLLWALYGFWVSNYWATG